MGTSVSAPLNTAGQCGNVAVGDDCGDDTPGERAHDKRASREATILRAAVTSARAATTSLPILPPAPVTAIRRPRQTMTGRSD